MATQLKLPSLAEGGKTGTVVKLLVSVGDRVEVDQGIVEVETEKAVVEVPATVSGVVREIHVREGDEVREGTPLITVDEAAGQGAAANDGAAANAAAGAQGAAAPASAGATGNGTAAAGAVPGGAAAPAGAVAAASAAAAAPSA
ncbi:MAG: biotin/lipoyl-binding protein, partial [Clostridia bacterium]|nr:biotin/lipoyl-binding protein [Clostridia bacterium]